MKRGRTYNVKTVNRYSSTSEVRVEGKEIGLYLLQHEDGRSHKCRSVYNHTAMYLQHEEESALFTSEVRVEDKEIGLYLKHEDRR